MYEWYQIAQNIAYISKIHKKNTSFVALLNSELRINQSDITGAIVVSSIQTSMGKKCLYSELFWSVFSRILTVSLRIQSEWGKISTRITPNRETFYAVFWTNKSHGFSTFFVKVEHVVAYKCNGLQKRG